eukprot:TRINITY_DN10905_c0_g1_i1.p1 TRINITY_DN10905_c0_g1~~TRINITY_DN10905_c0_g1_i1.p1  ORF type:complete len:186 (-),score=19.79 TRINITY_DN10905_c0_g1_i1:335-850(-)
MTYAAVRFSDRTLDSLQQLQDILNLENRVPRERLHATLLYSREELPKYKPIGVYESPMYCESILPDIKRTITGEKEHVLTLHFKCKELEDRFNSLMEEHAPNARRYFNPHVTLSYHSPKANIDRKDPQKLVPDLHPIEIIEEYYEPFQEDWQKSTIKTDSPSNGGGKKKKK